MCTWRLVMWGAALLTAPIVWTQVHAQTAGRAQPPLEPTLRIGVTAVEVDVVVTDSKGRHVSDLQTGDFELLQDGKPQTITAFRYVPGRPHADAAPGDATPSASAVPLTSSAHLRRDQAARIMAIVIDDLGMPFADLSRLREALPRFIDRMRADDAIAIVMTSHGVGRLQQFTNDKAALKERASRLDFSFTGLGQALSGSNDNDQIDRASVQAAIADYQQQVQQSGSLNAVQNVVRGMRDLPGRKSVVFVTEGFAIEPDLSFDNRTSFQSQLLAGFQRLVDEANRSFVVIHTLDARGVFNPVRAEPFKTSPQSSRLVTVQSMMEQSLGDSRSGPLMLADQAGGLSFVGNDFAAAFERALGDQEGYFVLGYQPNAATFARKTDAPPAFHRIKVRVKRSGLETRARSGFFGLTDEETRHEPATPEERLWNVVASPFTANDLGVRMTALFDHKKSGDVFHVLLHLDGEGLTFTKRDDGQYLASIELLATLLDGRGKAIATKMYRHTLKSVTEPTLASLEAGFASSIDLPATFVGAFQLRVAARDVTSDRSGTGYQFVRVPNLARQQLALSGVALRGDDSKGILAVRRFRAGETLQYAFDAYNARLDPASRQPALTLRLRLYREGALLLEGKPTPIDARPKEDDPERSAAVAGNLVLSPAITPGEYQLKLEVTDTRAKGDGATARQWVDFTIAGTRERHPHLTLSRRAEEGVS